MSELRRAGWELWIYTTSFRSRRAIHGWMRSYGIKLDGVINQGVHARVMRNQAGIAPSKNPAAFGIDLHVDDLEGVKIEGEQHDFNVVVVRTDDVHWTNAVLGAAEGVTMSCTEGPHGRLSNGNQLGRSR